MEVVEQMRMVASLFRVRASLRALTFAFAFATVGCEWHRSPLAPARQRQVEPALTAAVGHGHIKGGEFLPAGQGKLALELDGSVAMGVERFPLQFLVDASVQHYAVDPGTRTSGPCIIGSQGQCLSSYPDLSGLMGLVGLRAQTASRLGITAAIGAGYLGGPDGRNARQNSRAREERIEAKLAASSHIDLGVRLQALTIDDIRGVRMTARPVSLFASLHY